MCHKGFSELDKLLSSFPRNGIFICIESTGIYHLNLSLFLYENEFNLCVVQPFLVHSFLKSLSLRKTKTDKSDALSIAKFAAVNHKSLKLLTNVVFNSLKPLLREKNSLIDQVIKLKSQIKSCLNQLFPELMKQTNVCTLTILNLLIKFPSAHSMRISRVEEIQSILTSSKGSKVIILAENSIEMTNKNLENNGKGFQIRQRKSFFHKFIIPVSWLNLILPV